MADYIPNPYDTYEPEENTSIEADERVEIEIKLDTEISRDHTGYYDYADRTYQWAKNPDDPSGDWYSEEYHVFIGEPTDIVECIDEMLSTAPNFPESGGRYKVTGVATLVFDVTGIEESPREYFTDYGGDTVYDSEINTEYAEVEFNKEASSITDLKFIRI